MTRLAGDPGRLLAAVVVLTFGNAATASAQSPNEPPTVTLSAPATADPGSTVTVTATANDRDGSITKYEYDLDGVSGYEVSKPVRTFGANRATFTMPNTSRTVSVRVTDNGGGTDGGTATATDSATITPTASGPNPTPPPPNQPPVANWYWEQHPGRPGEAITFDATPNIPAPDAVSYDPDGTVVKYEWDFESDGTIDATGETTQHAFPAFGIYKVRLTVTDDDGASDSKERDYTVAANVSPALTVDLPKKVIYSKGGEISWTIAVTDDRSPLNVNVAADIHPPNKTNLHPFEPYKVFNGMPKPFTTELNGYSGPLIFDVRATDGEGMVTKVSRTVQVTKVKKPVIKPIVAKIDKIKTPGDGLKAVLRAEAPCQVGRTAVLMQGSMKVDSVKTQRGGKLVLDASGVDGKARVLVKARRVKGVSCKGTKEFVLL